jgi:hypothetical protein
MRWTVFLLAWGLLAGCVARPDPDTHRAFWWDAALVEAELGVEAIELPAGEPLWDFPVIAVTPEAIRFDSRPWLLALEPDQVPPDGAGDRRWELALTDGEVPAEEVRGSLIQPLYDELNDFRLQARRPGAESSVGGVNIVADASVPGYLLHQVAYTTAQSGIPSPVFVGRVGETLRGAHAGRPGPHYRVPCAAQVVVQVTPTERQLMAAGESMAVAEGSEVEGLLRELAARCEEPWSRWHGLLQGAKPEGLVDPARWSCVEVRVVATRITPAHRVLPTVAAGYPVHPEVAVPNPWFWEPAKEPRAPTVDGLDGFDYEALCGRDLVVHHAYAAEGERRAFADLLGTTGDDPVNPLLELLGGPTRPPPHDVVQDQLSGSQGLLEVLASPGDLPEPTGVGVDDLLEGAVGQPDQPSPTVEEAP